MEAKILRFVSGFQPALSRFNAHLGIEETINAGAIYSINMYQSYH